MEISLVFPFFCFSFLGHDGKSDAMYLIAISFSVFKILDMQPQQGEKKPQCTVD
jgi:hypothetical protein